MQRRSVPNHDGDVDVLDRNRAVLDLVASDPLEILHGRVTQRGAGVLAVSASLICLS
jgi:hypothetical protein